ncbi:hypothetical protein ACFFGF_07390 [Asaia lannensis]|uniref:Lipoprotein n=1 Tax=Asaia lannensis NBRC 102526 TaxID=1307926 RepID=A0ABT1CKW1_9PROT|nr:hypothetical protein [Asaia lannensis]MCO6160843.1 hypothetical protein [Asaia lannensis NBRC 102526]GBR01383.1 hypothetical protein AA102526_2492 [Asaia lannensis NBRC 102526]
MELFARILRAPKPGPAIITPQTTIRGNAMRLFLLPGLLLALSACTTHRPPVDTSREALLRPVASDGNANAPASPAGRKTHGHLYMGSGFGGTHP